MSLESARAKLANPDLGSLTPDEMNALLAATAPAETRPSKLIHALVDQIIDITNEFTNEKAKPILYDLLAERTTPHIDKTWSDEEMQKIAIGR